MSTIQLIRTAAVTVLVGLVLSGCRGRVSTDPPVHLNPNMDNQWRFDRQEPNEFFADNRGMRASLEGTVPHGTLLDGDDSGDRWEHLFEGRVAGEWTETLPAGMALDRALLDRGQKRYAIYCVPCHGGTGRGDGVVVQRGYAQPQSFLNERLRAYPLGRIVWTLRHGKDNMPSYAAQVPVEDRWAVAAYVRALQIAQTSGIDSIPQDVRTQNGWGNQ